MSKIGTAVALDSDFRPLLPYVTMIVYCVWIGCSLLLYDWWLETGLIRYSAHADQSDLLKFIRRIRHKSKEIRIVHGNEGAKIALKKAIEQLFDADVIIPNGS